MASATVADAAIVAGGLDITSRTDCEKSAPSAISRKRVSLRENADQLGAVADQHGTGPLGAQQLQRLTHRRVDCGRQRLVWISGGDAFAF